MLQTAHVQHALSHILSPQHYRQHALTENLALGTRIVLLSKSAIKEVGFRGATMKGQWVRVRVRVG